MRCVRVRVCVPSLQRTLWTVRIRASVRGKELASGVRLKNLTGLHSPAEGMYRLARIQMQVDNRSAGSQPLISFCRDGAAVWRRRAGGDNCGGGATLIITTTSFAHIAHANFVRPSERRENRMLVLVILHCKGPP